MGIKNELTKEEIEKNLEEEKRRGRILRFRTFTACVALMVGMSGCSCANRSGQEVNQQPRQTTEKEMDGTSTEDVVIETTVEPTVIPTPVVEVTAVPEEEIEEENIISEEEINIIDWIVEKSGELETEYQTQEELIVIMGLANELSDNAFGELVYNNTSYKTKEDLRYVVGWKISGLYSGTVIKDSPVSFSTDKIIPGYKDLVSPEDLIFNSEKYTYIDNLHNSITSTNTEPGEYSVSSESSYLVVSNLKDVYENYDNEFLIMISSCMSANLILKEQLKIVFEDDYEEILERINYYYDEEYMNDISEKYGEYLNSVDVVSPTK